MLHVVLLEPEIPFNCGNIGRTCLAAGARLHLVGRLGFHLDGPQVRRAGLDYWEHVDPVRHVTWEDFLTTLIPGANLHFFSTKGGRGLWDIPFRDGDYLVFGRETAGFPAEFHEKYCDRMVAIPQVEGPVRSLNLSTAAGIVLYEAVRQVRKGGFS